MANLHVLAELPEGVGQAFGDEYRSVLAPGTADADREIAAVVALQMGEPGHQHVFDLLGE